VCSGPLSNFLFSLSNLVLAKVTLPSLTLVMAAPNSSAKVIPTNSASPNTAQTILRSMSYSLQQQKQHVADIPAPRRDTRIPHGWEREVLPAGAAFMGPGGGAGGMNGATTNKARRQTRRGWAAYTPAVGDHRRGHNSSSASTAQPVAAKEM